MTRILFVCMGNICRSPIAEGVMRALWQRHAPQLELEVDSAATHDYHGGEPPDPRSQRAAAAHGVDLSRLRARMLTPADFARFDQILVMDRANLEGVRTQVPAGSKAKVRLLLDCLPEQPVREVPDPYYGAAADFEYVYTLCHRAGGALLRQLCVAGGVQLSTDLVDNPV